LRGHGVGMLTISVITIGFVTFILNLDIKPLQYFFSFYIEDFEVNAETKFGLILNKF
jgi:hypothetical protein